jgi:penicillin-binding protein 1C
MVKNILFYPLNRCWKSLPRWLKLIFCPVVSLFLIFLLFDLLFPISLDINYSPIVQDNKGVTLHTFLTRDHKWRLPSEEKEITPLLYAAFIEKEDHWFKFHPGINPLAVIRAIHQNIKHQKRKSGASTITMQVARMVEPKTRSYSNKLIEIFRALQLEWHLSKRQIMQLYVNLVPYGGNIEGVKSASIFYFDQEPEALSPAQVATLVVIPNNPQHLRLGIDNDKIIKERNLWLKKFAKAGVITYSQLNDALNEPLEAKRHLAPNKVPHLSVELRKRYPAKTFLKTFIDQNIQDHIESISFDFVKGVKHLGVTNAAVIVIRNSDRSLVGYVGSVDFNDIYSQGQVDGVQALRSPGSTLKPFLYAMAIDKGIVTPKTILSDVPVDYAGYRPENYDEKFHGMISMENALALSLNVPAVTLLNEVGVNEFSAALGHAGFNWISRNQHNVGLSLILGGCGVNLEELTSLYAAFPNHGVYKRVQMIKEVNEVATQSNLFSDGAAFMVSDILTKLKRPDLPQHVENSMHLPRIAWKTGTSYGRRDAWAIGYNSNYTIGVWLGNFEGKGVPELSGADFATPLLFRLFNAIDYTNGKEWLTVPKSIDFRLVCSMSGLIPNDHCTNRVIDYFIPGISTSKKCEHLKAVYTDISGKISYCRDCMPTTRTIKNEYPNLPPEIISFYNQEHIPYKMIPKHNPYCTKIGKNNGPVITLPTANTTYLMHDNHQQLLLSSSVENGVSFIYWYINNKMIGRVRPNERLFFTPPLGKIKISCNDDKDRNSNIYILVTKEN